MISLCATLLGLAIAPISPVNQDVAEDPYGTYTYVKGMKGDQEVPEETLKGSTVEIEEGVIKLVGPDGQVQFKITYMIDEETEDQVKFSMKIVESIMEDAVDSTAKGLAKAEGTELTLIYDYVNDDHPEDFTPDGAGQHLFVIKKKTDVE